MYIFYAQKILFSEGKKKRENIKLANDLFIWPQKKFRLFMAHERKCSEGDFQSYYVLLLCIMYYYYYLQRYI